MAREPGSLLPWATGKIGAGVSMAWKASVIRDVGFDVSLDTLTPVLPLRSRHASSAEDLAAFFDALVRGYSIVFTPDAIVHHEHRRTREELASSSYWHGLGLSAYLTRCILKSPGQIPDFVRRIPTGLRYGFAGDSVRNKGKSEDFPGADTCGATRRRGRAVRLSAGASAGPEGARGRAPPRRVRGTHGTGRQARRPSSAEPGRPAHPVGVRSGGRSAHRHPGCDGRAPYATGPRRPSVFEDETS